MTATDPSALAAPFASSQEIQGIYQHYKGNRYRVLGKAKHSETLEEFVVYQALYGAADVWLRPAEMFFGNVQANGQSVPRFAKVDGENR
jgi:hypothetical protein